jgi:putative colanic acid biosynthesis acetyltransferase WcaF
MKTQLNLYNNSWYKPGRSVFIRMLWQLTSSFFVQCSWNPSSGIRVFLLRLFGASIGKSVVIKPSVQIKYPWLLTIGDYAWIGEHVWIDNLAKVEIGSHACLSQAAYILTGNHDYSKPGFDLIVKEVKLEEGVWIGAKAIVCPGVTCFSHAVLTAGSIARSNLNDYTIYSGNPATAVKERVISSS